MISRFSTCVALSAGLALAGCSEPERIDRDSDSYQNAPAPREDSAAVDGDSLSPPPRAVRIGELGPRFDACNGMGRVTRSAGLPVYDAPFEDAKKTIDLRAGQRVYICNTSLDQEWLGIVVAPTGSGEDNSSARDCGVSSPVRSPRPYQGPCESGWVEANFVKLIAG